MHFSPVESDHRSIVQAHIVPFAESFCSDCDATQGDEILDIPITRAEPEVEPDGLSDDVGLESISVKARRGSDHPVTLLGLTAT